MDLFTYRSTTRHTHRLGRLEQLREPRTSTAAATATSEARKIDERRLDAFRRCVDLRRRADLAERLTQFGRSARRHFFVVRIDYCAVRCPSFADHLERKRFVVVVLVLAVLLGGRRERDV